MPECALASPDDIAVLRDGAYLVHAPETPIALIDSSGNVVRRFGGMGEGPGEFRSMGGLGTTRDGRVWMFDVYSQRKLVYDAVGDAAPFVVPAPFTADLASFQAAGQLLVFHNVPPGTQAGDVVESWFVATDLTGDQDEVARLSVPALRFSESDLRPVPPFFSAIPAWDVFGDGTIVYSNGDTYDIYTLTSDGGRGMLAAEAPLRRVTSAELDGELDRARRKGGLSAQLAPDKAARAPSHHPAIASVVALDDELVAVATASDTAGMARWDILDLKQGDIIGQTTLGEGEAIVGGGSRHLLLLRNDDNGAPMLVQVKVDPGAGAN